MLVDLRNGFLGGRLADLGMGAGAAPIIAKTARERGILTVGVVTKPFMFEGRHRMKLADAGVSELQRYVDTLIVIPNQNLFRIANEKTTFAEAFGMADQVLHSGVRSITDLMVLPGLINLDFADVRTVMTEMGKAMMGTGEASGEDRALMAAQNAIQNPLLDEVSLKGAKAVLVNVTGGLDMTLLEVDEAANAISSEVDQDANIIFGAAFDPALEGRIRVSVVATGMDSAAAMAIQAAAKPALQQPPRQIMERPPRGTVIRPGIADEPASWGEAAAAAIPAAIAEHPMPEAAFEVAVANAAQPEDTIRIVDPAVDDLHDDDLDVGGYHEEPVVRREPEIQAPRTYATPPTVEHRRPPPTNPLPDPRVAPEPRKGGFLSLFGSRPRYDAPPAQPQRPQPRQPYVGGGQAAAAQQMEPVQQPQDAGEDLEIPSFLRRLAN